jgi:hypothetical protein
MASGIRDELADHHGPPEFDNAHHHHEKDREDNRELNSGGSATVFWL